MPLHVHTYVFTYVTGYGKTVPIRTRIEIHFIAYYNIVTLKDYPDTVTQLP